MQEPPAVAMLNRAGRRLSQLAVVGIGFALVGLVWIGAATAIRGHRTEAMSRIAADAGNAALLFEAQFRRQLLAADQTLRILEQEWQRDPAQFDLDAWERRVVVLTDVALQIFIADSDGTVRASTRADIIGNDISKRDYFQHAAALPADDEKMFMGAPVQGLTTRQWQLNLARRLDWADGRFAGVIAASYDIGALSGLFGTGGRGNGDMMAVIGTKDGIVRAGIGDAVPGNSIAGSALFAAMTAAPGAAWIGPSPIDGVTRVHGFGTVPGRDLEVVVGLDSDAAMAPSRDWERGVMLFAAGITALITMVTIVLLHAERSARQREQALARDRSVLADANAELAAAEARARAKTVQLGATLSGMTDGIMMVDAEMRLIEWNEHFAEFTGVPADILRPGLPMAEVLRGQALAGEFGAVDIEAEVERRMALLRSGATIGTVERVRPNGHVLEIRRAPLEDGGFVSLYTDVTARRQAEDRLRQAQTMAAIGRLTSGVAHDFNNLLASVIGNAELLTPSVSGDARSARRVSVILQAATRGATLVRQLLAFSRKQALTPTEIDVNAAIADMRELLVSTVGAPIELAFEPAEGLWKAQLDAVQFEHVILNLAINARDAMPDGGRLTISTANRRLSGPVRPDDLPEGDYVTVTIADSGTGMSEEVVRNAFEPFFTTKPPGKGSGLGLSQVYGVARQSGGGVQLVSRLGVGTSVSVFFPRTEAGAVVARPAQSAAPAAASAGPPRRILLVDDDPNVRETLTEVLTAAGFDVAPAAGGQQARRMVEAGLVPDVMMVDFAMPDMDGVQVAAAIRGRLPDLPVLFVTGYVEDEVIRNERWVLVKPFVTFALLQTLGEMLAQAGPRREAVSVVHCRRGGGG
jgi:signal transduction histidine kinase